MTTQLKAGAEAVAAKGWLGAHKWLLLRRATQIGILLLFMVGPWFGLWIVKGNLNYSYTLDVLPLADPYVLLQSLLAGHVPEKLALIGAAIVPIFYVLVGGRAYCAWVCPVNMVTDAAAWLRARLGIKGGAHVSRQARYWVLAMTLVLALTTGTLAWELINPVSMLHRGIIFGMGAAWTIALAVFLLDLFRHEPGLVRPSVPGGGVLQRARHEESAACQRRAPRAVQRLHGLLRRMPRASGHTARAQGRGTGCDPAHPVAELHQLRALHRRMFQGCIRVRITVRQAGQRGGRRVFGFSGLGEGSTCQIVNGS